MPKENKEPFHTARMSPEAVEKLEAIRAGSQSKENPAEGTPSISGGDGKEQPPVAEPKGRGRKKPSARQKEGIPDIKKKGEKEVAKAGSAETPEERERREFWDNIRAEASALFRELSAQNTPEHRDAILAKLDALDSLHVRSIVVGAPRPEDNKFELWDKTIAEARLEYDYELGDGPVEKYLEERFAKAAVEGYKARMENRDPSQADNEATGWEFKLGLLNIPTGLLNKEARRLSGFVQREEEWQRQAIESKHAAMREQIEEAAQSDSKTLRMMLPKWGLTPASREDLDAYPALAREMGFELGPFTIDEKTHYATAPIRKLEPESAVPPVERGAPPEPPPAPVKKAEVPPPPKPEEGKPRREKGEAPKEGREEKIGEDLTALENLFGEFYSEHAKAGKLAPELTPDIKQLEAELRKLGVKRDEIDELREKTMKQTGYWSLLPREAPPEPLEPPAPEAPAPPEQQSIEVTLASGEKIIIAPENVPGLERLLAKLETRQKLHQASHQDAEDPKIAAEISEIKNVLAEAAKAGWIASEAEPLGPPAPEPEPQPEPAPEPPPPPGEAVPVEPTAPEAFPDLEARLIEVRLTAAREALVKAEQNWGKYQGLIPFRVWFGRRGGKAVVEIELDEAKAEYERARAERVGAGLDVSLEEERRIGDERVRVAVEKRKGMWEKVSDVWKWLGDQNLEKVGWKPQGRFGRIIARAANLRMAAGLGLMGMAVYAGPGSLVTLGALGARRAMAGVGATMFSSEWLKRKAEVSRTTISDKELEAVLATSEAAGRLGEMLVGLRLQGKLASESEDYKKLFSRYEALMTEEYQHAGKSQEYLTKASAELTAGFSEAMKRGKKAEDTRRLAAIAAGVGAAIGVSSVLRYLYGVKEVAGAVAPEAPGLKPPLGEYVGPEALEDAEERMRLVGAEAVSVETISAPLPDSFETTVQYGEGPIHEARKAIAEYIALYGDEKLKGFTKAQRILAEEKLYRAVKDSLPKWEAGAKVSFPRSEIESILNEVKGQTPERVAALDKNLAPFVEKVRWPRYQVEVYEEAAERKLYKPWEWDEGIRRLAKGAARTAEAVETPRYVPFDPAEEAQVYSPSLEDLETKAEALKDADPQLSEVLVEDSKEAEVIQDAALEARTEEMARLISRLDPEEYRAIKDLKVSEALKKTFFGTTEETIWPSSRRPNHMDLWRKGKLRDGIAYVLERLPMENREKAAGLTIHQFIKEYYLKGR